MVVALAAPLSQLVLSPGSAVTVSGLTWKHYQLALAELGDARTTRLTYHQGVLELRMPSLMHELINRLLGRIIFALAEELGLGIVDLGSTTWNREDLDQGIEPDSCFYIQHADRIQGLNPDIPANLPPDLAVEVDIASASGFKLAIYQALGVPEVWIYRKSQIQILDLRGSQIQSVECSLAFPAVTAGQLLRWIQLREIETDLTVVSAVRHFCQALSLPSDH
ncbi:Uma2 family endonuclease [Synechococcales cyanobacterium C]|uniref:Uma2 family endonuclease n=1 Tax=Petrachloros mirabilis ULC683 TaxID=2781853 RepID=A0A8K1ZXG2_9CYAN|nr:Uma2 family endonuclease [Petrachloros mirabilis]NCJ07095.1 Uma2 family endonuclease [Petrachloros mirabilis ULC683]